MLRSWNASACGFMGLEDYPEQLRDAQHPVELLYFQGYWDLLAAQAVAVVGTRLCAISGRNSPHSEARSLLS